MFAIHVGSPTDVPRCATIVAKLVTMLATLAKLAFAFSLCMLLLLFYYSFNVVRQPVSLFHPGNMAIAKHVSTTGTPPRI